MEGLFTLLSLSAVMAIAFVLTGFLYKTLLTHSVARSWLDCCPFPSPLLLRNYASSRLSEWVFWWAHH
jgi:hypothetical protein